MISHTQWPPEGFPPKATVATDMMGRVGLEPTFSPLQEGCCSSAKTSSSATDPQSVPT